MDDVMYDIVLCNEICNSMNGTEWNERWVMRDESVCVLMLSLIIIWFWVQLCLLILFSLFHFKDN